MKSFGNWKIWETKIEWERSEIENEIPNSGVTFENNQ